MDLHKFSGLFNIFVTVVTTKFTTKIYLIIYIELRFLIYNYKCFIYKNATQYIILYYT